MIVAPSRFVCAALAACITAGCASAEPTTPPAALAQDATQLPDTVSEMPDQAAAGTGDSASDGVAATTKVAPTLEFAQPADKSALFGKISVQVSAKAFAPATSIAQVHFAVDDAQIGTVATAPWQLEWNSDPVAEGTHKLTVTAKDNLGQLGFISMQLTVDRSLPVVTFGAPQEAALVNGDTVPVVIAVEASDNLGVENVEFTVGSAGGEMLALGKSTAPPYAAKWTTIGAKSGLWTLQATARDAAGHATTAKRTVQLARAPIVLFSAPTAGTTLAGKASVSGIIKRDFDLVGDVALAIDGKPAATLDSKSLSGNFTSSDYLWKWTWDTTAEAFGEHTVEVAATDSAGQTGKASVKVKVDQPLSVQVSICSADLLICQAPFGAQWLDKAIGGKVAVKVQTSDDNSTTTAVEFAVDGVTVAKGPGEPWTYQWDTANVKDGLHNAQVKATTSLGEKKAADFQVNISHCAGDGGVCDDANACTVDACTANNGCSHAEVADDGGCDLDGSACTIDICKSGTCLASGPVVCNDKNSCTADACDPTSGKCAHIAAADDTSCNDGDLCTSADMCKSGSCKGIAKVCANGAICASGLCLGSGPDGMVLIPPGKFKMGCVAGDNDCIKKEMPQHEVYQDGFYLDVDELTIGNYKKCVDSGKCTVPDSASAYCNWNFGKPGKELHPVNCVTWIQADAYCAWVGKRLPTESEWEKASRGGVDGNKYPWGDVDGTCTPGMPNSAVGFGGIKPGCDTGSTYPVGTGSAKNGYGLYDMSGNVWEWVSDRFGSSYYEVSPAVNPTGPESGAFRVNRGGGFGGNCSYMLRSSMRGAVLPNNGSDVLGFRCAQSLPK